MAQINLAPGSQYLAIVRRRRRMLYGASAAIASVAILTGIVLSIMVADAEKEHDKLKQDLQNVETSIAQASEEVKRIQLFESRTSHLAELLQKHKTWSLYLQEIERLLPPDTVVTSIQGNHANGTLDLIGFTPNIDRAAEALASLQNQPVTHATLFTSGSIRTVQLVTQLGPNGEVLGQRYSFTMSLSLHIPENP